MLLKNIFLSIFLLLHFGYCAFAQTVFINEINHLATTKGVEIAGPANTNLLNWSIVLYDEVGDEDGTIPLNAIIPDLQNNFGFIWIEVVVGFQGPAGGAALVDDAGSLVQFLSYGGLIKGESGIAYGIASKVVGTQENEDDALQLTGDGMIYDDFVWDLPGDFTPGALNNGQEIVDDSSNDGVLSITWAYFRGDLKDEGIHLQWATKSEENADYFKIEHSSNGQYFEEIGQIEAVGNSQREQRYEFQHDIRDITKTYYRLVEKDLDGKLHFSEIIQISKQNEPVSINLFPNPVAEKLWINVPTITEPFLTVDVFNAIGKRILTAEINANETALLDVSNLTKGNYFVVIRGENLTYLQKIIMLQ